MNTEQKVRLRKLIDQTIKNASDLAWLMGKGYPTTSGSYIGAENALKASELRLAKFIDNLPVQEG